MHVHVFIKALIVLKVAYKMLAESLKINNKYIFRERKNTNL